MKVLFTILFPMLFLTVTDVSLHGVKIGDPETSLSQIDLAVAAREEGITKFKTLNGNDFSITCKDGKVVYMENDWLQDPAASASLLTGFEFGKTTLRDLRKRFDTNGFTYSTRGPLKLEDAVILFNCFELDSPNNEILITITKVPIAGDITEDNLADRAKLDALIIADARYLDEIWGSDKVQDPNYKKVKL